MTEVEQPPQNGIDLSANEEDENSKARPADIEQDMREMERRKRVEAIMGSKLFREELERIVDSARDSGNTAGILQQLSDIVGVPASRVGSVYKASNCMMPINDIRGVESMGYAKGEKILRCKLAATFRLLDLYGWTQGLGAQITARLKVDQEYFLVNPYGLLYHEITASSLNKVDMQGQIVEQGTTNFGVNKSHFILHSVVHAARPDIRCAIYIGCSPVVAISSLKTGLLPLTKDACVLGEVTTFSYTGCLLDEEERDKLVRNLGPNSKVMLLTNHGALCCGETIEEAFFAACHIVQACETQLKLLPVGLDNLVLIPEESRKTIYEQSRRPPEDLAKKFAAAVAVADSNKAAEEEEKKEGETTNAKVLGQTPKWRVGGAEFEALMRMLDNAGYRTGYIYRHPLIKSDPPKPKNDVELPPAVSSLGYLLEEEELFRQGIWKKGVMGKGGDRSRWLNSPNVYQKVEVLETGTPDPKKITKWVAEGSPTHSTPVRIDDPLQFVPVNTNPKEFKRLQQQIKDNRRADKISAGPQSHILEGVTWDEANRIKDATVSQAGDHVVLMGAASKGIIQRGFQHNATVYKAPYAKNPFDNVTDDELNEYKRTVERKKKSIHGEYTDTDFSESEALSSLQTSGAQQQTKQNTTTTTTTAAVSQSEPEDISEHQVMRIETQQAPVPSQPEVVLSDATLSFINGERSHTATNRKPPTGRDITLANNPITQDSTYCRETLNRTASHSLPLTQCQVDNHEDRQIQDYPKEHFDTIDHKTNYNITTTTTTSNLCTTNDSKTSLINELKSDKLFQRQKRNVHQHTMTPPVKTRPLPPHYTQSCSTHTALAFPSGNDNTLAMSSNTPSAPSVPISICNSIKSQVKSSLLYDVFSNPRQKDTLSYYTTFGFSNSPKVNGETSPIYDNPTTNGEGTSDPTVRFYTISSNCCSPQICEPILECLQKPAHHQQNYVGARSYLDLIWNIPIRRNYSPSVTPEVLNSPPAKFRAGHCGNTNSARQSRSPYRTLSHFGFNSPQRDPQPDHKHVLPIDCRRYIPLRRSVSYEEIFASPRYMDLCEHCFELIVRLKPELMQYRVKLHNLAEYHQPPKAQAQENAEAVACTKADCSPISEDDFTDCSANEPFSVFTSLLEPLIEVEEKDSSDDRSITNSTFIDKITRMNYSEISNNFITTPHSVNSQLSLEDVEEEDSNVSKMDVAEEELSKQLRNLEINGGTEMNVTNDLESIDCNNNDDIESEEPFVSITDVWEFNNWFNEVTDTATAEKKKEIKEDAKQSEGLLKDLSFCMDCEKAATTTTTTSSSDSQNHGPALLSRSACSAIQLSPSFDNRPPNYFQRSLMNRDERSRRKLEFQELWEDHVRYFENREQVMASASYSDTESAIDETQHAAGQPQTSTNQENNCDERREEIFNSQSFIYPHKLSSDQKIPASMENLDDDEIKSTTSRHTFNISESNSSQENLVYSMYGSTNTLEDYGDNEEAARPNKEEERDCITPQQQKAKHSLSSREHLPFRTFQSSNMAADLVLSKTVGYTNPEIGTFIDDDNEVNFREVINEVPGKSIIKDTTAKINILEDLMLTNIEKFTITNEQPLREEFPKTNTSLKLLRETKSSLFQLQPAKEHNEIQVNRNEIQKKDHERPLIRYRSGILSVNEGKDDFKTSKSNETDTEMPLGDYNDNNCEIPPNVNDFFEDILRRIDCLHVNDKKNYKIKNQHETHLISDDFSPHRKSEGVDRFSEANHAKPEYSFFQDLQRDYNNKENKENEQDEQLSPLEKTILQKIEFHQLNKTEEIFNKIEKTIRNKLTPSKLEMLVKEQVLDLYKDDDSKNLQQRNSTPRAKEVKSHVDSPKLSSESLKRTRRSRSLTPLKENCSSPVNKCNKTTTPPVGPRKQQPFSPGRTPSPCSSTKSSNSKRRNFILENIRNAATPRNSPQVKRLQVNTQAIFCKNPFGPRQTTSANFLNVVKKSLKSPIKTTLGKPHSSPDCSTKVYAFQSKLVRGSPRFWVSLSQSPLRKTESTTPSSKANRKGQCKSQDEEKTCSLHIRRELNNKHSAMTNCSSSNSVSTTLAFKGPTKNVSATSNVAARVEAEINALDEEILKMQTHLENSKNKLCDVHHTSDSAMPNRSLSSSSSANLAFEGTTDNVRCSTSNVVARVDAEIDALGEEIQKIQPRLETYKRKLDDFGNRVAKCARNMDECVATQEEIISEHCELKECLILQQYVDNVTCRVQTFSLSETDD